MKRFLIGVTAASLLLMQGVAGAVPTPVYDVTCVVGGETTATWRHAKLDQATLEWFTAESTTPTSRTRYRCRPTRPTA